MKNILIIADGILAKSFLERVFSLKETNVNFIIITYRNTTLPKKPKSENFKFLSFDPTSLEKLKRALFDLNLEFSHCMINMKKLLDTKAVYNNIRQINSKMEVYLIDFWGFEHEIDDHLTVIDPREILASRFLDYLPDVPVVADNIGFGEGEIMSVRIPYGSSFAYRRISTIAQKGWKICMIYRGQSYFVVNYTSMILPNDTLLVVGDPKLLRQVFRSIKQNLGLFPSPFGSNILTIIDMKKMSEDEMQRLLEDSLYFNKNLINKRLYIKVINAKPSKILDTLKTFDDPQVNIKFDYFSSKMENLKQDVFNHDIGVIITNNKFFESYKKEYFELRIPILKVGKVGAQNLQKGVILGTGEEIELNSSVILDICSQLNLEIELHHYEIQKPDIDKALIEHFKTLSKIFNKNVEIINDNSANPILKLKQKENLLQFVNFSDKMLQNHFMSLFSNDMDRVYFKLEDNYQLFVPNET